MPPQLRTALVDDVDDMIVFWQLAGENDGRPTDSADAVRRLIERDPDALLVAELGGVIVGTVIAGWDGWRAHLYRLAVHPDHRRLGIGRLLLNAAEARLEAFGASRLDAMVLDGNELGQSAWQARGYRPQPDWSRWVKAVTT